MVLKSYFDGASKADSRQYEVVSLAVASATKNEWEPFECDWREMLKRHHADYLHTTDAVTRVNHYESWTERQAESFLRDCARITAKHFIRLTTEYDPGQFGIYCFVFSIVLADFVEHCKENPLSPKDANQELFGQAIANTVEWSTDRYAGCGQIHCFFDRGEPFYGYLINLQESKRASKDAWLLNKIEHKTESNSQLIPALQLADLFAWVATNRKDPWNPSWKRTILNLPYRWKWMDKTNLHNVNDGARKLWDTWKIPKRAATK